MKRAKKAPPPAPHRARPVAAVLLTLGAAGALLFGLSWLGDEARRNIGPRDRYAVRVADIRCAPPPSTPRETFLAEVRYAADLPLTIQSLDPDLTRKLTAAFAAHPWVAAVDAVTVEPPDLITVTLTFRKPALAVPQPTGARAVDAKGVLLPATASTAGLPRLLTPAPLPPDTPAGKPWPDEVVVSAAPVAASYKPATIERTEQGWELVQPGGMKLVVAK